MQPDVEPAYLRLLRSGELKERARRAVEKLASCDLCARYCRVDRLAPGEDPPRGAVCRTGRLAVVHGCGRHLGEERPIRGTRGSGTIFFSWCNLRCVFCQNWETSQHGLGETVAPEVLSAHMLRLQQMGCHNVNLVTPSHVVAQVLEALVRAAEHGLRLPIVYNTGGYDSPEALELLDGVVDIYMPDMKYGDSETAHRYSHVREYTAVNRAAVREMHRQVGDLVCDADGVAQRGLLVRHLVLPEALAGTRDVLEFLVREVSPRTRVNLMDQYRPCYRAAQHAPLDRPITPAEFQEALAAARELGIPLVDGPEVNFRAG
jgi:putative pyruvate formate lyase activating enzyme